MQWVSLTVSIENETVFVVISYKLLQVHLSLFIVCVNSKVLNRGFIIIACKRYEEKMQFNSLYRNKIKQPQNILQWSN